MKDFTRQGAGSNLDRRGATRWMRWLGLTALSLVLAACGGGGGGDDPELLPTVAEDSVPAGPRIEVGGRNLFALNAGDAWTYERRVGSSLLGIVERTVGSQAADGTLVLSEKYSDQAEAETQAMRVTAEGVRLLDPFDARAQYPALYEALPEVIEYPTPLYPVAGVRRVLRQGSLRADIDGDGRVDYYRAEFTQVFRGFEQITVLGRDREVAHFTNTLRFTIRSTLHDRTTTVDGSEEAYFADEIGLVRSDRLAVDGEGRVLIAAHSLVLVRAEVAGRAYPSGLVWRDQVSGTDRSLLAVTSTSTQAVAVGGLGTVVSSTDGTTWTARLSGVGVHLNGVAMSASRAVAVGDAGTIIGSADLLTWQRHDSGTTSRLLGVAWTGSLFVAVGESGTLLTSSDGVTWTPRVSGTTATLRAVAGHPGLVAAGGDGGTLLTSGDGLGWTPRTLGGTTHGLVWTGTQFLAVGEFDSPGFGWTRATSFDGITWAKHEGGLGNTMFGAAWSGAEFVAVGSFGVSVTSSDGVSWTGAGGSFPGTLHAVTWFKDRFVAVGSGGKLVSARQPAAVPATLFDVDSSGTRLIAVGALGTVRTSDDAQAWVGRSSGVVVHLQGVAAGGPRAVAVGDLGTIITSEDLQTWTARTAATTQRLRAVAWTGSRFVAVGDGGVILTSPDALSWTLQASGTANDLHGVAGNPALIVAVGAQGTLLTSADGAAWTPRSSVGGNVLHDVVWAGTQFLIAGDSGPIGLSPTLQTSADGLAWTARSGAWGNTAIAAAWSGARFTVVGSFSTVQTSGDGIAWTAHSTPTGAANLYGVAWHRDRFVAVGQFGTVLVLP